MSDSDLRPDSPPPPAAEEPFMSDPVVTAFLTQQLCLNWGRLALTEIPKYVELTPEHIASILREEARRFPQPELGEVLAQSPVRLCGGYLKNTCQAEECGRLHLCRHFILGRCFIGGSRTGKFCKFSHDLRCDVNKVVLKANEISSLREKELRVLLLLNDPSCMPEVCYDYSGRKNDYSGRKNAASCQKGDQCPRLHVCQYFARGECMYFSRCSRSHNLLDTHAVRVMKERGFSEEIIENIQLLRVHLCKELEKEQPNRDRRKEHPHAKSWTTEVKNENRLGTRWGVGRDMREATDHFPYSSRTGTMCRTAEPAHSTRAVETVYGRRSRSPLPPTNGTVTTYRGAEPSSNIQQTDKLEDNSVQFTTYTTKTVTTYPKAASATTPTQRAAVNADRSASLLSTCSETALMDRTAAQKYKTAGELQQPLTPSSTPTPNSLETVRSATIQPENTFSKPPLSPLITELDTAGHSTPADMKTKTLNEVNAAPPPVAMNVVQHADQPTVRASVNTASAPPSMNSQQSQAHASTLDISTPVQASPLLSQTTVVSTVQTLIPRTVTYTVSKDGGNASSPALDTRNFHYSVGLSPTVPAPSVPAPSVPAPSVPAPSVPATVTKADHGIAPGTKQARVPSNPAIYELNPFEDTSLLGPEHSGVRAYALRKPAAPEDRGDPNEICFYHIWKFCEKKDKCGQMHFYLPYRWQILKGDWEDLPWMEKIEQAYSDPNNTRSDEHDMNFEKMISSYHQVRRLSTPSSVTQPPDHLMTTEWVWHWKNEDGKWIEYGKHGGKEKSNIASADLETIYLADKESTVPFQAGSQRYEINFKDMIQKNVHYKTQKEIRRRPRFVSKDCVDALKGRATSRIYLVLDFLFTGLLKGFTRCWTSFSQLVEIGKMSPEFKEIAKAFGSTMSKFSIEKLQRIQNVTLWKFYQLQMDTIKKRNGKDVLEKKLFHGTAITHVPAICNSNFDWRICGLNGTVYGRGSYFARDASYSHNYCKSNSSTETMFLARVLVGDFVSGQPSYVLPPLKPYSTNDYYDSCVNNEVDPSIYVVFEKNQIYPEYLIEYGPNSACCLS